MCDSIELHRRHSAAGAGTAASGNMVTKSKTVTGVDGRTWTVRRRLEWTTPATGEEFEHDVDGGRAAAVLILSTLVFFYVALFSWMPADVHVPWWVVLAGIVVFAFFPVRWLLRRPWTLVAQTPGGYDLEPEHWVGMVRGVSKARDETKLIIRMIRTRGTPAYADSPLQPVS
jgi:hypothetical protein